MVTISDVAHAAGVSKATVSYVLSGDPRITQATTLKVQHAIDELGYTVMLFCTICRIRIYL